jgi:hypothetical protein
MVMMESLITCYKSSCATAQKACDLTSSTRTIVELESHVAGVRES